jgi:hypothetical protein
LQIIFLVGTRKIKKRVHGWQGKSATVVFPLDRSASGLVECTIGTKMSEQASRPIPTIYLDADACPVKDLVSMITVRPQFPFQA